MFSQDSSKVFTFPFFLFVALCLCAPRAGSRMRGDRPSPWIRFRTPSPALSTSRPRHSAGCIAIVSPRNHSLGSALVSVGWHLDSLLLHFFFVFSSVCSFCHLAVRDQWCPLGEWKRRGDGRGTRPCSSFPGWFLPIGILLRPRIAGPLVTSRPMGRFGPTMRFPIQIEVPFPSRALRCSESAHSVFWIG